MVAFEFGLVLDLNRFEDFGNSKNLGLHRPTPLRLNLILEIQSDPRTGEEILLLVHLLSPTLLLPRNANSTELCKA
jgi:hypothetical protein